MSTAKDGESQAVKIIIYQLVEEKMRKHRRFLRPSTKEGLDFVFTDNRAFKLEVIPVWQVSDVVTSH
ncbi:MAG: hypothetical protein RM368_25070 [Nostoc sp. DedSLP03]|uniref:hypothetical protein n=1 Tax=Nostoc sp. DedSLP03 TaxID=3075400 RepID=UPI002AD46955|nr:hypothetical protein [Nostoc sp. DedSLP03]MDZ7968182.1 hypothetical protein [Nostoc sp. DedSLP03]